MTIQERMTLANKIYEDIEETIINLFYRWQEEKDYEDINDYALLIKPMIEQNGGILLNMNKRPFGVTYQLSDAVYQISVYASGKYTYSKIAQFPNYK